jgi:putative DNA primase/helicase
LPIFPGCPVDVYLRRTRGIALFADEASSLRFHPSLYHWPSGSNFPAMLALVRDAAWRELTVHQTFLDFDGLAKAPVERPKLFPAGASPLGGGVWFGGVIGPAREFAVAEGIETLLSAMRLLGAGAGCAALSALGIRELTLPAEARRIVIFADRDPKGQGLEAARAAELRWKLEGRAVRVVLPDRDGEDANDILRRLARG